jgi:hypothetical protein
MSAIEQISNLIANSLGGSFIRVPLELLPVADCPNCTYMKMNDGNDHCYMFKYKPGERCGQFTKEIK